MPQPSPVPPSDPSAAITLSVPTGTSPFPNYLIDKVMPTLKDTEWRLLCVIVRQTLGWQAGRRHERKGADWLTHRQLKLRTGRASAALCKAIDTLVRRNLVEVRGSHFQVLLTPRVRQNYGGNLYFRLSPRVWRLIQGEPDVPPELPSGNAAPSAAGGNSGTPNNAAATFATGSEAVRSPDQRPSSQRRKGFAQSEIHKAKTTKETGTKYLSNDRARPLGGSFNNADVTPGDLAPGDIARPGPAAAAGPNPQVKQLLYAYRNLFQLYSPCGDVPPISWGRDGRIAKDLLKLYPYEHLEHLIQAFFETRDDWLRQRGYSLAAFRSALPALLMREAGVGSNRTLPSRPTMRSGHWTRVSPTQGFGSDSPNPDKAV